MGYVAHRPDSPSSSFSCQLVCTAGGLAIVLVAYRDLIHQLPQSVGFGIYGTSTIFLIVFFTGGTEGPFVASVAEAADVVATPIMFDSASISICLFIFCLLIY